jgi:hypothetical protein
MKYEKIIERIKIGHMTRVELADLRANAEGKRSSEDVDAQTVIDAIDTSMPKDKYILFMGFCPGADFTERLDIEWKVGGICRFDYLESEQQLQRFKTICRGDLVVLKKREQFGKTMKLYGHGRVTSIANDENNIRYLNVNWENQNLVIEVPLMACNSTVDLRSIDTVEREMPTEFWHWLTQAPEA